MIKQEVLEEKLKNLEKNNSKEHSDIMICIQKINDKLENQFVTQDRFNPVEKICYGLIGLITSGVIIAILAFIFKNPL